MKKMKVKPLFRAATLQREAINEEDRTVELAFSSEEPVQRWDGQEILDHGAGSVRLGRLQDGAPLLVGHNHADHVGVVESVSVGSDRRGRAVVRFGKSARAEEVFADVKDGILRKVSVGYRVFRAQVEVKSGDGDAESYRVTDWEPFEISLVSVPADNSVGVGRSTDGDAENELIFESKNEESRMEPQEKNPAPAPVDTSKIEEKARAEARESELTRVRDLLACGEAYADFGGADLARKLISEGGTEVDFNRQILERMGKQKPIKADAPDIGLSDSESRQFSFVRAMNALANPTDRRAQEAAAFEFECSRAASEKMKREARGIIVPVDVLKRDLNVGTATAGGHTVATDLLAGSFIDLLRNRAYMMQLATVLTDLNGNLAIPRQTGGATAYWVAESGAPTESQAAFDQVTLSPETVGAFTDFSRKLMLQSSMDVESFVRSDLARTLAVEIDRVCINGSGSSNEPTGILNTAGIGSVVGGTNGLAPSWSHIVDLESAVATDNADLGTLRYVSNAKVRGALKQTEKASGTAQFIMGESNMANGYDFITTNQVPSDLDKGTSTGVCSAILFGNFADLIIGMWGGLDLMVDPYSNSTSGTVRVVALQDIDVAVRHAESFAAMVDALTA